MLQKLNPHRAPSACRFSLRGIVRLSITAFSYFNARTMNDHEISPLYQLFLSRISVSPSFSDRKTSIVLEFDINGFIRLTVD
jgi:hypothetical protein